jgi:predicted Zn-dependent peptidase
VTRSASSRDQEVPRFPIERARLANGLRIVVQRDPRSPLVASMMCYAGGSRHDPASRSGLAHLAEHLAFDGPRRAAARTFAQRIEAAGGSAQAVTMADRVCFTALFPPPDLAAVLATEAERMIRPLDPRDTAALETQRRVLLEELRHRSVSRVRAAVFEQVHRCLYPAGHPYHRPPAGDQEGIRAVTPADLEVFVARNISPEHAVLVLVGDLPVAETFEEARRAFESAPAGHPQSRLEPSGPPEPSHVRVTRVPARVATAHAHVAWSVPGFGMEGWHLAALLVRGLAIGRSSPLAQELVDRRGLAQEVRGSLITMRDCSTLLFEATAASGVSGQRLEEALQAAVEQALSERFSAAAVARSRKKALSDHYSAVESFERRADLCAAFACYLDAPERLEHEPQRYLRPDEEALAAFGSGLARKNHTTLSLIPMAEAA